MPLSLKVAVIGAGVSGLATARELLTHGHSPTIFEQSNNIGGTWAYTPSTDSDPTSQNPTREIIHSSLYESLRTNLPRPLMGFTDFPFPVGPGAFPSHVEVLPFLERFAEESGVIGSVRFGSKVVGIRPVKEEGCWEVEIGDGEKELFDAVVVCNGHHTEPKLAQIPGIEKWPGMQIHSHNYRIPKPFQNQIIVIIGRGPSGHDISRELSKVSKEVHLASRSPDFEIGKVDGHDNIWQHSMIKFAHADGMLEFHDGSSLVADVILHCTGYKYKFPFVENIETIHIDDNRVGPLYKHVFPPHFAPWLSFVGLTNKTIIFMTIELQAKWVVQVLSGIITLPTEEDMTASIDEFYKKMEENGTPKHLTHALYPNEVEYLNWLRGELGLSPVEDWRIQMYRAAITSISSHDDGYRDNSDPNLWSQP